MRVSLLAPSAYRKLLCQRMRELPQPFGATAMDVRHDIEAFFYSPVEGIDLVRLNQLYDQLEQRGRDLLAREQAGYARVSVSRGAQMRYVGQSYEVETPVPAHQLSAIEMPQVVQ